MTAPTHVRTAMTDAPDTTQPPASHEGAAGAATAQPTKSWTANALVAALTAAVIVLGGALVGLLVHEFNSIDDRFAAVDERFDSLDQKVDDLALQLTALVAALNKTDEVDAALARRLLTPDPAVAAEPASAEP